ncbi:hypothetical protein Efla_000186 [Eimeria flavescens]
MSQPSCPLQQVPPEPPFHTTNGLYWSLRCKGKELTQLPSGPAEVPVYVQLGSGQFGRVFEVLPAPPPPHASCVSPSDSAEQPPAPAAAATATAAAAAAAAATAAATPRALRGSSKETSASLPRGQLYAAKLLPLSNFASQGTTSDLLREFSLYRELDTPEGEGGSFANILRVYGIASCTAGVLVVEQCASDLAAFAMLLQAQGKLNHSALKFYAWQLLNGNKTAVHPPCLGLRAGVARLHGRGIVHRDLKPENILVSAPPVAEGQQLLKEGVGILKVADLGLGRKIRSLLGQQPAGTYASPLSARDESQAQQQQQEQQQQQQEQPRSLQNGELPCMRQSGRVVTLPYRPPEILSAAANNQSAAKLPVASYSSACDMWSLGVILLELCLPQRAPRPHRWNFAFIMHAVGRAAFQMEFMILENILKVLGRPKEEEEVLDMIRLAGSQRADLLSFVGAFPALSHSERKMALLDFILEKGGLHLDALGLDLLARLLHVAPSHRLSAHCALSHPWFHDLPFNQMNRLGLSFHLSDLEIPALRASLPSPLRRCLSAWEARGRYPSSTRFACHDLLQQALLQQQQQQQQQQQRTRCCASAAPLPPGETAQQANELKGPAAAETGHECPQHDHHHHQQQQQQQQQTLLASRRSGESSRRSGSSASMQKLRSSSGNHSSLKASSAAAATAARQQLQQQQLPSSSTGSFLSKSGSARCLRSSGPSSLQRRSSSSMNRRSESLSREQKQKREEGPPPPASNACTRGAAAPQAAVMHAGRQKEQRLRGPQQKQQTEQMRASQRCAGSDDEVVRSPWRCTRLAAGSASTSVLQCLPAYPSGSLRGGPPLPGRGHHPSRAPQAIIAAAAAAACARKNATSSPAKCRKAAAALSFASGESTPYHDALSDHSCSPAAAACSGAAAAAAAEGLDENVDSSQGPSAHSCAAAASSTKARRRGGGPSQSAKGARQPELAPGGPQADASSGGRGAAGVQAAEHKTQRRGKRPRRGSATTTGNCLP